MIQLALELGASRIEVAHVQYYGWSLLNRAALLPTRARLGEATAIVETARDRCRFLPCQAATLASSGAGLSSTSSFQHVAKGAERPQPIRDDLNDRQHGNRQNRAGYAPHPVPEDQREDDSDRIDGEAPS